MSDMPDPAPAPSPIPADREPFWRQTIAAFHSSGLSVRAFCRQRGLPERRFHAWRKTLGLSPVARPVASHSAAAVPPVPGFLPVRLVADATAEVVLPGGVVLRVREPDREGKSPRGVLAIIPPRRA